MNITYRPLNINDAASYRKLRLKALREAPTAFTSSYEEQKDQKIEFFQNLVDGTPRNFINGAFDESRLVGTLGFYQEPRSKRRHLGTIVGMFVDEAYRGNDIAQTLLKMVINRAKQLADLQHLLIEVSTQALPALHIYEQAGFSPWGREPGAIKVGQELIDTYHMILSLSN